MEQLLIQIAVWFLVIMFLSLPLHFGVKILNGRTHLIKTMLVQLLVAIIVNIVWVIFPFGIIVAFFVLAWLYREFFRLKWIKAFILIFLQFIIFILMIFLLSLIGLELLRSSFMLM